MTRLFKTLFATAICFLAIGLYYMATDGLGSQQATPFLIAGVAIQFANLLITFGGRKN